MKLKNFKMLSFILASFAVLALSGCNSSSGTSSNVDAAIADGVVITQTADAGTSTVTANLGSVLADGTATSTVTVTVKDVDSAPITNATVSLDQGTGSSTIGTVTNNLDGTYTFDVTSTTVETVTYTATADTVVITQTVDVVFTAVLPPLPDTDTSTVTASPASVAANGIATSTVTVTVNDAASDPITNAAVSLDQGAGSSAIGAVTNNLDGTYTFDVNSTTVETVTYTATADSVVITQTDTVDFTAPVPDAATSTVTVILGSALADGTAILTVTVTVKDADSYLITNAAVSLDQDAGSSSTIGTVTNVGDGTYTFDVNSTTVETVTYTATADTVVITQTADVVFTSVPPPVPDAGTSTVTRSPASVAANGIATSTVTVTVNDAASDPITNAAVSLDQGAGSSAIGAVTNNLDGTYTFDVNSTTVETVTYTATADTVVISQTVDVDFTAPVPDAATSTVTVNLGSVLADGTETSTVTVTVKDADSYLITNAAVSLDQGAGSSAIGTVTNNLDGTYTFDVNSTTVETVTYIATANAVVISQTVNVDFTETEAQCLFAAGYDTIEINGRTWLDRNLGATQAAINTADVDAYGDYYQWGRSADGHQVKDPTNINTTTTLADSLNTSNTTAWYGKFIVNNIAAPNDWTTVDSNGNTRSQSWSTLDDPNQICPCGYIVPTEQDFVDLNITANAATFNPTYPGWRRFSDGTMQRESADAYYWTSDTKSNGGSISYDLRSDATGDDDRAYGLPVRCIKLIPIPIP